jgi:hypothetical protein
MSQLSPRRSRFCLRSETPSESGFATKWESGDKSPHSKMSLRPHDDSQAISG